MSIDLMVDAVGRVLSTLSGMKQSPPDPTEKPSQFPFSTAYPSNVGYSNGSLGPGNQLKDLNHQITAVIYVQRKDLPRDVDRITKYAQWFAEGVRASNNLDDTVLTIESLDGTFGDVQWAEMLLLGWTFTVNVIATDC